MRKIFGVLLSILCICCAAIGLTSCKKDKHIHAFDKQVITDEYKTTDATCTEKATYYYSCSCGEKGTETFGYGGPLGHSFTNYVSDNNATCTQDGTKTAKCDRCSVTDTIAEEDSKLGHSFTNYVSDNNATCTQDGTKTATCDHDGCNVKDTVTDTGSKLPHTFDKQVANEKYLASPATCTEAAKYYYSCTCGEKGTETFGYGDPLGHSFTNYVSDNNATCTQDGTKTATCDHDGCNVKDTVTDTGSKLPHTFDKQVANEKYFASPATCTEAAKYYYSCTCGEKGTETFTYGVAKGHTEVIDGAKAATCTESGLTEGKHCSVCNTVLVKQNVIPAKGHTEVIDSAKAATCTESGLTEGKHCSVCNTVLVKQNVVPAKGHTYSEKWTYNESEHWHSSTCGHNVEKDRATHTFDENKKCTVCDYITVKPLGLELQSSVFNIDKSNKTGYLKVANAVTDYDFSDKFTVADGARFDVCTDKQCNNKIASKKTDIVVGDNIFYILVTNGNDVASYTVTLRRRPIYTVTFNANGGTAVNSQSIEEDSIIPEPVTTRAGYTFISWSYDFTQPIIRNTAITATWTANTDTAYKVEYYLENIDDADYSLYETESLQGTTDTTATAEIKTYDHFTFYKNKSISSGNVSGDGSLVLKVYYTRNTYTLSNANASYGAITNAVTKKYGSNITSVVTEYLGCEFLGWYNGEELLSIEKEYTFTVEYDVTAKFKVKDEMSNFNFNRSVDTCNITGLKDKTISEIIIPDYVTSIGELAFGDCSGLISVTIGNSVTSIGSEAFYNCSGLTSVIWNAENCTAAGSSSYPIFSNCSKLTNVTIGENVKIIPYSAFYGCSGLTNVTIPDSVTYIGEWAFEDCIGLTSVTIGNGVTSIGRSAFSRCSGLTSITIPDSVTSIGEWAFCGCSGLTSLTIPNGVTSIGQWAFEGCSGLTSVIWNAENCTAAGSSSYPIFSNCSKLTNVTIGNSVTSIGSYAFYNCSGLTSVNYLGTIDQWTEIYFDNGVANPLYYAKKLYINNDLVTEVNLTTAAKISAYAFYNCSGLTSITIPDSVTSIGRSAFSRCSGLTSITIPDSVTSIGEWAFDGCSGLTSVYYTGDVAGWCGIEGLYNVTSFSRTLYIGGRKVEGDLVIPDSVTSIGAGAFCGCDLLESITLPFIGGSRTACGGYNEVFGYIFGYTRTSSSSSVSGATYQCCYDGKYYHYYIPTRLKTVVLSDSVTSIGEWVFCNCRSLTNVTIGNSVTSIGSYAFSGCSGLTSVTIPDSVKSIEAGAFSSCNGIESLVVTTGNKKYHSANNCIIKTDTKTLIAGCKTSIIPSDGSVTIIGYQAFWYCSGLTSVTIPDSVTSIGSSAFSGCSGLTNVTIPDSVTSIGSFAFSDCSGLTNVTIPDSVTSIGDGAFYGCYKLVEVISKSGLNITKGSSNNGYIAYYSLKVKKDGTSDIVNKDGYLFYTYDNVNYLVAYIGSNTDLTLPADYNGQNYEIYNYAFYNCSGLTSVTIPDSVTAIGSDAFYGCNSLKSITLPFIGESRTASDGYDEVLGYIFGYTTTSSSSSVSGATYQYYGYGGRYYHYYIPASLKAVILSDSVTSIGSDAFSGCRGLTSVTIPNSVTSIGNEAFYICSGLTSVTIPDSVTSIGDGAFYGCSRLRSVTIPDSVTSIDDGAFYGCNSLESITLPFIGASRTANSGYKQVFGYIFGYTTSSSSSSVSGATYQCYYNDYYDGKYYHYFIPASLKAVILSDNVTSIGYRTFYNCSGLTSVTIGNGVTSIGSSAFYNCSGLTSVTIGNGVTSIGYQTFYNCSGLTSVTIPDSVTSIGEQAFGGCSGIESLIIATGNKKYHSANNCIIETDTKKLIVGCKTSIIPSDGSVTSIGESAFYNCSGLTSVTIPDSVTSIGDSAFYGCYKLVEVINKSGLNITKGSSYNGYIAYYALNVKKDGTSDIVNKDGYLFYTYDNVNYLLAYVGSNTDLTLPTDYNGQSYKIYKYAFYGCSRLTSVTIPDSVTSIGDYAFSGCSRLRSVTIPDSVTSIGSYAFSNCSGLKNITYTGTIADWKNIDKGSYWKNNVPTTCVIHCTDGDIGIYD